MTLAWIAVFGIGIATDILASSVIVPRQNSEVPGEGGQAPFSTDNSRFLAIYPASEFIAAMPEGGNITQLAFRLDEAVHSPATGFIPDVEIRLSTTSSLAPQVPNLSFSSFVGPDVMSVRQRGSLLAAATASSQGLNPFTFVIAFDHPFFYDPRSGNLSLDILTFRGFHPAEPFGQGLSLDAASAGDSARMIAGGITSEQSIFILPAPVVQVSFMTIPEPSSTLLFMYGLVCLWVKKIKI